MTLEIDIITGGALGVLDSLSAGVEVYAVVAGRRHLLGVTTGVALAGDITGAWTADLRIRMHGLAVLANTEPTPAVEPASTPALCNMPCRHRVVCRNKAPCRSHDYDHCYDCNMPF